MNLQEVFDVYRGNLAKTLSLMFGDKKYLFMEKSLLTSLDRLCSLQFLKNFKIEKMYHLTENVPKECEKVIIMIPPSTEHVKTVISILRQDAEKEISRDILIVFSPMITIAMEYLLTQSGFIGNRVRISELDLTWIALDEDLLCTSWPNSNLLKSGCFNTSYCLSHPSSMNVALESLAPNMGLSSGNLLDESHGDTTWPYRLGYAVAHLLTIGMQSTMSNCQFYGLGASVPAMLQGINQCCQDMGGTAINAKGSQAYAGRTKPMVFLFGREVDFITPFLLPVTFEALLNEVLPFDLDTVVFPKNIIDGKEDKKVVLNSIDPIYSNVRGMAISDVSGYFRESSKAIDARISALQASGASVQEYREFVVGGQMQAILQQRSVLSCLFAGLDTIVNKLTERERVEDLMRAQWDLLFGESDELALQLAREWLARGGDGFFKGLRILCLISCIADGLVDSVYNEFARLICQSSNYTAIYLLYELRRLHIFEPKSHATTAVVNPPSSNNALNMVKSASSGMLPHAVSKMKSAGGLREKANAFLGQKVRSSRIASIQKYLQLLAVATPGGPDPTKSNTPAYAFAHQYTPPICKLLEEFSDYSYQFSSSTTAANVRWQNLDNAVRLMSVSSANGLANCQLTLRSGSRNINNFTAKNSGDATHSSTIPTSHVNDVSTKMKESTSLKHEGRIVVVVMAGGCSYAELAALRRLAENNRWKLFVLTTAMLGTTDLITSGL